MTVWVVIPARNEEQTISAVITAAGSALATAGFAARFVVVNDGSTDATRARARATCFAAVTEVIDLPHSGIGAVFNAGLNTVLREATPADVLAVMEGDNTTDAAVLPALLACLNRGPELAIASRIIPGGGYRNFPPLRLALSLVVNRLFAWRYRQARVSDYTFFYRVYRVAALRKIWPDGNCRLLTRGFEANTELLLRLLAAGCTVDELPYVYDYSGKQGSSKLPALRTIIGHLRILLGSLSPTA